MKTVDSYLQPAKKVLIFVCLTLIFLTLEFSEAQAGILYPRASETRSSRSLDGIWLFSSSSAPNPEDFHKKRFKQDVEGVRNVPVPSSYNDLTPDESLRDHVGLVWYQRDFFVPKQWQDERVWLRFGSVSYSAVVWVNGNFTVSHEIGHLPFQAEVTSLVVFGGKNTVTVAVDNTLNITTIPQGTIEQLVSGRVVQNYAFDFFNYAGIDRSVLLYTTPQIYIDDVTITTDYDDFSKGAVVNYDVVSLEISEEVAANVSVLQADGQLVASSTEFTGSILVPSPQLWWPYLMDDNPGYMYRLEVELRTLAGDLIDRYVQPFGIRTISWNATSLLINNRKVYLRGFGKHEDSDLRGRGFDLPIAVRDFNLMKWAGANSFRTSHYPYAEEILDLADQLGIMVIVESPACNTEFFSGDLLINHRKALLQMISRDKNRPSVIMWSAGNNPASNLLESDAYFAEIVGYIKYLDSTRPVTIANSQSPNLDYAAKSLDVICLNYYSGWYEDGGYLDQILPEVTKYVREFHDNFKKPIVMTEYGADAMEGLHFLPAYIWSEEYQMELLSAHFEAFDQLRNEGYFIGEMVWNFADFKTKQDSEKAGGGNKKGVFTRSRQPKASAYFLRKRYWALAQLIDGVLEIQLVHLSIFLIP